MIIETTRLLIRPIVESDWVFIKEIWQDFNKSQYAQYDRPHNTDDKDVLNRIKKWANINGKEHMFFAICLKEKVIGYVAFNLRDDCYEIGYCFNSKYEKNGYAKESFKSLFDYVKNLGITKLKAGTAIKNIPSVALLKSLGFKQIETEKVSFYKDTKGKNIVFTGGIFELDL